MVGNSNKMKIANIKSVVKRSYTSQDTIYMYIWV